MEIKGGDLRRDIRSGNRATSRRAYMILDDLFDLLEKNNIKITARAFTKNLAEQLTDIEYYPLATDWLASTFDKSLKTKPQNLGFMILDSRTKNKNTPVASHVVTGFYKKQSNIYSNLIEAPTFGHSDTHVGLQIADIIVSAILFPIICNTFIDVAPDNVHCNKKYDSIKERYGTRLEAILLTYTNKGATLGGIYCTNTDGNPHQQKYLFNM